MWEKVRGVFLMPSNGKNVTNFFPHLVIISNTNSIILARSTDYSIDCICYFRNTWQYWIIRNYLCCTNSNTIQNY